MDAMANRLADATSPYLLQHEDNPVDWWPWSEAAFAEARRRDVPVLLSVGYAACHWCHVMAHESFEDDETAAIVNAGFVPVKVDREERPDVDAVYMAATQAMTGQGGWPMTCFLTPDGAPFYCGTYFPSRVFQRLLDAVTEAWRDRRDDVRDAGQRVVTRAGRAAGAAPGAAGRGGAGRRRRPRCGPVRRGQRRLRRRAEVPAVDGAGVPAAALCPVSAAGGAARLSASGGAARTGDGLDMVVGTAEAMARGGMYDQLAGGFARYSVDAGWVVPHFEKMLYDNALLLRVYLHLWRVTGSPLARRVVHGDRRVPARRPAHARGRVRLGAGRRHRRRRGPDLRVDAGAAVEVLGDADGEWAAQLLRSPRPARSSTARPPCSCAPTRTTPPAGRPCGSSCSPPGTAARSRPATTRSSPPGTAWRSPRWPRPARCSASRAG